MIIRHYRYRCESCGQPGALRWQAAYPETRVCPVCGGTMRIQGIQDRSSTDLMRERMLRHV